MKFKTMPQETVIELLLFLAENEDFASVTTHFQGSLTPEMVREVCFELAQRLRHERGSKASEDQLKSLRKYLSPTARTVLDSLSPREEQAILKGFSILED